MILDKLLTFLMTITILVTATIGLLIKFTDMIDGLAYVHIIAGGALVLMAVVRLYMMMPKSKAKK